MDKKVRVEREDLSKLGMSTKAFTPSIDMFNISLNVFPRDLAKEKSIEIHVYDTSKQEQVYDGLINSTNNIVAGVSSMFADSANTVAKKSGWESMIDKFSTSVKKGVSGFFGTGDNSTVDTIKGFFANFPEIDISPANAKLNKLGAVYYETFFLPIPNNLQESLSNQYEEKPGWINDMPGFNAEQGGLISGGIRTATSPTTTWSKLTGARSLQYYENKIQMYNSTEFREIQLQWHLVPNSQAENILIHEMVRKLKMYASPETAAGNLILKSPCFFGIEFNNKTLEKALQFNEVVLTNIDIEYVPGGNMETYDDNMPKHVQLSMTFRDRQPKLKEDWENPSGINRAMNNNTSCPTGEK